MQLTKERITMMTTMSERIVNRLGLGNEFRFERAGDDEPPSSADVSVSTSLPFETVRLQLRHRLTPRDGVAEFHGCIDPDVFKQQAEHRQTLLVIPEQLSIDHFD